MGIFENFFASQASSVFHGLTGHYELKPDSTKKFDLTQDFIMSGDISTRVDTTAQILKQIGDGLNDRNILLKELKQLRNNDIVLNILSVLEDDGFACSNDANFMSVEYMTDRTVPTKTDKQIQEIIDSFLKFNDIAGVIKDLLRDLMLYGEHFLPIKVVKGKGVVEINDNADIEDYLAIYKGRQPYGFLYHNKGKNKYELYDKDEMVHFCLDQSKIKVSVAVNNEIQNIPETIRIGQSVVFPVLSSLRKLNVLEVSSLAMTLKRVLAPTVVTIQIPENTNVNDVPLILDRQEQLLNSTNAEAMNYENLNITDLMQTAARFRVFPKFGDGKGTIEQIQFQYDDTDTLNKINDIKKTIALNSGIPSFYLSLGEQSLSKNEMLKVYSAYSRKLTAIQNTVATGVRTLVYKHLQHLGYFVNDTDIHVKFKSITNVDMLDDIEVMVNMVTTLRDFFSLYNELSSSDQFGFDLDKKELLNFYRARTASFPDIQKVIKLYQPEGEESMPEVEDEEITKVPSKEYETKPVNVTPTAPTPTKPQTPNKTQVADQEVDIGDVF